MSAWAWRNPAQLEAVEHRGTAAVAAASGQAWPGADQLPHREPGPGGVRAEDRRAPGQARRRAGDRRLRRPLDLLPADLLHQPARRLPAAADRGLAIVLAEQAPED